MQSSPLLEHLIENLRCLPGVGPKSAQRMAYHLLQRNRSGGMNLARALTEAMSKIGHCSQCRDFTEEETCNICNNPRRQNSGLLCVVEMPADIQAIEQTGTQPCTPKMGRVVIEEGGKSGFRSTR